MRLQGKILNWNDDKGFGFVEPNGGGERAFVHIKAFKPRSHRPVNGEVIVYELVKESNNRYKAENIQFAREVGRSTKRQKVKTDKKFSSLFTLIFCIALFASVSLGKLSVIVIGLYIVMSLVTFITYAIDKSSAQNGGWRTRESTLHFFALIGGWPGAFYAQKKLRHKSIKKEFQNIYWVTVIVNVVGFIWLHSESGRIFLDRVLALLSF